MSFLLLICDDLHVRMMFGVFTMPNVITLPIILFLHVPGLVVVVVLTVGVAAVEKRLKMNEYFCTTSFSVACILCIDLLIIYAEPYNMSIFVQRINNL